MDFFYHSVNIISLKPRAAVAFVKDVHQNVISSVTLLLKKCEQYFSLRVPLNFSFKFNIK
jgi:hypothetical protein